MNFIIPLSIVVGIAAGVGAGLYLPGPLDVPAVDGEVPMETSTEMKAEEHFMTEFFEFNDRFIVPVTKSGKVMEHFILSIGAEVPSKNLKEVERIAPKLRAEFISVLFDQFAVIDQSRSLEGTTLLHEIARVLQLTTDGLVPELDMEILVTEFSRQTI